MIIPRPEETYLEVEQTARDLLSYCETNQWAGFDPYDGLNSRALTVVPFLNRRVTRIALTQAVKRSPVNFRRLLCVPVTQNPKAIALFLSAIVRLAKIGIVRGEQYAPSMIRCLIDLKSKSSPYWCWG